MRTHIVKSWPKLFQAVADGLMPFQYRENDRKYQKGDTMTLQEYQPITGTMTGRELSVIVDEVWDSTEIPGLPSQFVLMRIHPAGNGLIYGVGKAPQRNSHVFDTEPDMHRH